MPRAVLGALAVLAVLASACELRLATEVRVEPDGAGEVRLRVAMDDELEGLLRDAGFEPLVGVDQLREAAPRWTVEPLDEEGGHGVALTTRFDEPGELSELTRELQSGLAPEDGRLFEDLDLRVGGDGRVVFGGRVGLVPPEQPGVEGADLALDRDDFARFVAEEGDDFVRYDLRVTLPGTIEDHDADQREGGTLTWSAPVGSLREVRAVSEPTSRSAPLLAAIGLLAAVVAALAVAGARYAGRRRVRTHSASV